MKETIQQSPVRLQNIKGRAVEEGLDIEIMKDTNYEVLLFDLDGTLTDPGEGITEFLQRLCSAGKKLIVATSKPEKFARIIIDHFHLSDYFVFAAGSEMNHQRTRKWEVIEYALQTCGITDRTKAVMIGAKKCNLDSIGVLYGYGDLKELEDAGADFIAKDLWELENILLHTGNG